jgi:DNA-binding transcriptional regulator YdaS (Cro superfamily)
VSGWRIGWAVSAAILFVAALACDEPSAPAGSASPTSAAAAATTTPKPDFDAGVILEEFPEGAPRNEVRLQNPQDNRFMARASVKMFRLHGNDINPYNLALAQAGCTDCQTIVVAVQVVFYQRGATNIQPQNIAIASNVGCTRCVTIARAIQYVIPVDDLKADVPEQVKGLVKDIDKELRYFAAIKSVNELSSDEAATRLQRVLDQYADLRQYLHDVMTKRTQDNEADPQADQSASPSPGTAAPASASPGSAEPTASPTTSPTPTPSATP